MDVAVALRPARRDLPALGGVGALRAGAAVYLSLVVLIPLAAIVAFAAGGGWPAFWSSVADPETLSSLELTAAVSAVVVAVNAVGGTLIAWVLVRDSFPGRALLGSVIDLPFALPTIVAGLVLLELYGPRSPMHLDLAYTRAGIVLALLFVTLPFVVRAVEPVLLELDRDMEEAAASLGAGPVGIFRRIMLPNLLPAILSGSGLGFARSMGEFGSVVLISGNIPFATEVASVRMYGQISSGDTHAAASLSVMLLLISLLCLLGLNAVLRWRQGHAG